MSREKNKKKSRRVSVCESGESESKSHLSVCCFTSSSDKRGMFSLVSLKSSSAFDQNVHESLSLWCLKEKVSCEKSTKSQDPGTQRGVREKILAQWDPFTPIRSQGRPVDQKREREREREREISCKEGNPRTQDVQRD